MEVRRIPKKTVTVIEPKRSLTVDKEKYRQKRVAAYCRVSTDSEEQLTSYKTQMKVYSEMIAANPEWCFAGMYADEGISGTRADKRTEFQKMIKDCLNGKIDYIITKSVSRFARNTVECLEYVRMLKNRGIGIFFEEQNIDTLKSDSELYLVIYAGFAQSESESISKNITWSFRKNFEDGKVVFVYKRLLGYRKGEDGQPEIVPEEAKVVEQIFAMYLSGLTARQIVDRLHGEGVSFSEKNIQFSVGTVMSILTNVKYCGDAILQKTVTVDCIAKLRKKNTGEAPMYYVHNNHPAIVSRDTFNKVQEEVIRRKAKTPKSEKTALSAQGRYSRYALSEIMKCAECGSPYKRCTWSKKGKKRVVWRCVSRLDHGTTYCKHSPTVDEEQLKSAIVKALNKFNSQDASSYLTLMRATVGEAIGLNGNADEIDILERRIESLNKKMITLVSESVASGKSIEDCDGDFKEIADEIELLQKQVEAAKKSTMDENDYREKLKQIDETIEKRKQQADEYDDTIVRQMIECIKVHSDGKLEVIFGGGYTVEAEIETKEQKNKLR